LALKFKCKQCGAYIVTRFLKVGEVAKCRNCGAETTIPEHAEQTDEAPTPQQAHMAAPPSGIVPTYLTEAILATIFCCVPFGIVAIIYAAQAKGALSTGNMASAIENSKTAKTWCWIAFGVGLGIAFIYLLFLLFIGLAGR
jgi:hypothetical protein